MDDHDACRRRGPRFSDTDSIFNWIHERFCKSTRSGGLQSAAFRRGADWRPPFLGHPKNTWPFGSFLWTSRRRGQLCFCRSEKPNRVRLCDESNGAIAFAECEIITARRGDLPVAAPCVSRAPYAMLGSAHRASHSEARTWSSKFGLPCSGAAGKKKTCFRFIRRPSRRKAEIGETTFRRIVVRREDALWRCSRPRRWHIVRHQYPDDEKCQAVSLAGFQVGRRCP